LLLDERPRLSQFALQSAIGFVFGYQAVLQVLAALLFQFSLPSRFLSLTLRVF
jgi:hypothetical protein